MTEPVVLRVTRHFEASPERVFDASLDPAQVGQFCSPHQAAAEFAWKWMHTR